jgi:Peptidase family M48
MVETKRRQLRTFPGLRASDFQHEADIKATRAARRTRPRRRGLEDHGYGFERLCYLENVASNVRVTTRMFPRVYKSLLRGSGILGVEEPELYVAVDPIPNAYTYGHTKPFLFLTSGLVDILDDEERFFVIGHELGHIKADHVLYTVLAKNIAGIVSALGQATLGIGALLGQGLVLALNEWYPPRSSPAEIPAGTSVRVWILSDPWSFLMTGGAPAFRETLGSEHDLTAKTGTSRLACVDTVLVPPHDPGAIEICRAQWQMLEVTSLTRASVHPHSSVTLRARPSGSEEATWGAATGSGVALSGYRDFPWDTQMSGFPPF